MTLCTHTLFVIVSMYTNKKGLYKNIVDVTIIIIVNLFSKQIFLSFLKILNNWNTMTNEK